MNYSPLQLVLQSRITWYFILCIIVLLPPPPPIQFETIIHLFPLLLSLRFQHFYSICVLVNGVVVDVGGWVKGWVCTYFEIHLCIFCCFSDLTCFRRYVQNNFLNKHFWKICTYTSIATKIDFQHSNGMSEKRASIWGLGILRGCP